MNNTHRFAAFFLISSLLYVSQAHAQTTAQQIPSPTASAPSTAPANVDPKNLAIAKELIQSFDMNSLMQGVFGAITRTLMPMILRDNPNQLQQVQKIAMEAVQKSFMAHMDELANNKAIIYAQMYSYDELVQLKAFYQSPVGQKMLKTMPEMMQKSMILDKDIMLKAIQESTQGLRDGLQKNGLKVPKEMGI